MTRRRPKGSMEDLLPDDRHTLARMIWDECREVVKDGGAWELREAAKILGIADEVVDVLLRDQ